MGFRKEMLQPSWTEITSLCWACRTQGENRCIWHIYQTVRDEKKIKKKNARSDKKSSKKVVLRTLWGAEILRQGVE